MVPHSQGRTRMGYQGTGPTISTARQCCTHLANVSWVRSYFWEFLQAKWPCTRICPLENCYNTGRQNPPRGTQQASTSQMLTTDVRRNLTRLNMSQPTYCQVLRPFAFHQNYLTFFPTASSMGWLGPLLWSAMATLLQIWDSPKTQLPPQSHPHQQLQAKWPEERA